jgi:hypothetical protein
VEYLLGILGIIISIGTFLIGYRQTVGAKKERVRAANDEIEKIMVRRIVLEHLVPSTEIISRLMEAKSRDFRVKVSDIYSESQMLNTIFTRIMETDLIAKEQRDKVVENIEPILLKSEKEPFSEQQAVEIANRPRRKSSVDSLPIFILGVIASIIGAAIAMAPEIIKNGLVVSDFKISDLAVLLASVIGVLAASIIVRFKDRQEETSRDVTIRTLDRHFQLEAEVLKSINKIDGITVVGAGLNKPFDFMVNLKGRKTLIEVKSWNQRPPISLLKRTIDKVVEAANVEQADDAFIVTKERLNIPPSITESDAVKIITLSELKARLVA